jgi:hydroxylamine oxidation protein HaoB
MLGWFAFLWLSPGPAPYHYRLVEEGGIDKFSKLGLDAWPDLGISKQEIRVEGVDEPVAVGYLARRGNTKPVMLAWENYTGDPLVFVTVSLRADPVGQRLRSMCRKTPPFLPGGTPRVRFSS